MQGKKTSSKKIAEVCAAKVADPDLSIRDIEEQTGINRETARVIINEELPELLSSSAVKQNFFDTNLGIIHTGSMKVKKAMETMNPEDIKEAEIFQKMVDKAFLQNRLVDGESTQKIDIGDFSSKTQGELEEARKALLG